MYNINDEFGQYTIELTDKVIADIQVATARDFQTMICAAIQVYCGDPTGRELAQYLQKNLFDLRMKTPSEKKAAIEDLSKRTPRAAYAEARIFRCLRTVDKHPVLRP